MRWPVVTESGNTWTHLGGAVFALSSIWMVWLAAGVSWQMVFGVICFLVGMFFMFLCSAAYHWTYEGQAKRVLRKCDHISIYVMIASSYTPILIGVIGGCVGWSMFALQWAAVVGGAFYKIFAMGRWPRFSLVLYLVMGWSIVFIAEPLLQTVSSCTLLLLLLEGIAYTSGTYFFVHDDRRHFHAIWHVFVLLGALAHWGVILTLL